MPGHDDADAFALAGVAGVGGEQLEDAIRQRRDEPARIARGRHRDDRRAGAAHRIGQHQERAAGADVDGDTRPLARVDVEQRRLPSAGGLADGPFDDVAIVEELLHEQADRAGPHAHAPRQVGARDRLMAADQREGDLPVDLA